ncbi:MAG: hypothetical protein DSY80_07445 [Desulfocapsa sp.]|nr:MAG: hypothetical protein DSY80_07445 [Desulfocapsa sp.]
MVVIEIFKACVQIARFVRPLEDALKIAKDEVKAGNHASIRPIMPYDRSLCEFDRRPSNADKLEKQGVINERARNSAVQMSVMRRNEKINQGQS